MKILMVSRVLYPRTLAETVMFRLADALAAQGHEILWFAREDKRNLKLPGAFLLPAPDFSRVNRRVVRQWQLWDPETEKAMEGFLAEQQPDAALVFNVADSLTYSFLRPLRAMNIPALQMVLEFDRVCPCGTPLRRKRFWKPREGENLRDCCDCSEKGLHWCVLRRCSAYSWRRSLMAAQRERYIRSKIAPMLSGWITSSEYQARQLQRTQPDAQVRTFDLPLPPDAFEPREPERGGYFAYVGKLSAARGIWEILHAMTQMADKEMRVVVAGDGPEREAMTAAAEQMGLTERLVYVGILKQPALTSLIAGCDALLVPSRRQELGPLVMLEAQAMGKPVIATDIGVLQERVLTDYNGWSYPLADEWGLVHAMDHAAALTDKEYRQISRQTAEEARSRYHPEVCAARILEIIGEAQAALSPEPETPAEPAAPQREKTLFRRFRRKMTAHEDEDHAENDSKPE